jgi:exonuclease III
MNPDSIIGIQESHLSRKGEVKLRAMWKYDYALSPSVGNCGGCLLLLSSNHSGQLVGQINDNRGRLLSIVLKQNDTLTIHANNDRNSDFFKYIFQSIYQIKDKYNIDSSIVMGDWNVVMNSLDGSNRKRNTKEVEACEIINENMNKLILIDAYRVINPTGGFTWTRGSKVSRLDMIFDDRSL